MCCDGLLVPVRGRGGGISSHAHKTGSWYLLRVLLKIYYKQPHLFYVGVSPWGSGCKSVQPNH